MQNTPLLSSGLRSGRCFIRKRARTSACAHACSLSSASSAPLTALTIQSPVRNGLLRQSPRPSSCALSQFSSGAVSQAAAFAPDSADLPGTLVDHAERVDADKMRLMQHEVNSMAFRKIRLGNVPLSYFNKRNLVFADKTRYVQTLEDLGSNAVLFLRPRRFGKTLFTDILQSYYDRSLAAEFDANFSGTWIHDHRTPLASSFCCLRFDFSLVPPLPDRISQGFIEAVISGLTDFTVSYPDMGLPPERLNPDLYDSPSSLLIAFMCNFMLHAGPDARLFLIIDEYDYPASYALSSEGKAFHGHASSAALQERAIKSFYTCIKSFTGDSPEQPIAGIFITGVLAESLDSVTSGFSIAQNISTNARFNAMAGFTHDELSKVVDETVDFSRLDGITKEQVMEVMERRYDGYSFSQYSDERIFCPDMCLNFLSDLIDTREIPQKLAGINSGIDAGRLGGMLSLALPEARDSISQAIFSKESVAADIPDTLNLKKAGSFSQDQTVSLLAYLGFLTIDPETSNKSEKMHWRCPNEVCYRTFVECEAEAIGFRRSGGLDLSGVTERGDIMPLVEETARRIASIPASAFGGFSERCLQIVFYYTAMDGNDSFLQPEIECDTGSRGRADLFIRNRRSGGRQYLLELKYLSEAKGTESAVASKLGEAKEQLARYRDAPNFKDVKNLDCWAIVFVNKEPKAVEKLA